MSIKRHAKVKSDAHPYDPKWESYYEQRLDVHMAATLKGKGWLLHLWKEQKGLCPMCQQKITKLTGWHSHHVAWNALLSAQDPMDQIDQGATQNIDGGIIHIARSQPTENNLALCHGLMNGRCRDRLPNDTGQLLVVVEHAEFAQDGENDLLATLVAFSMDRFVPSLTDV